MSRRRKRNRSQDQHQPLGEPDERDTRSPLRREAELGKHFHMGKSLVERCGSIDSVEALTHEVLPLEPFDWTIVPAEDRAVVEIMLRLIEPVCEDHLDSEYFTVVKRLIQVALVHPAQPLRTRTSPERLAAALAWTALVANMDWWVMSRRDRLIWRWFDVTSCTRLAHSLATKLGFRPEPKLGEPVGWDEDRSVYVRDTALLTSRYRRELIAHRDKVNDLILEGEELRRLERPMVRSGNQVRMRLVETEYALSARTSLDSGRQVVVLGLGGTSTDPDEMFALSIPEARRLLAGVQSAVDSLPLPAALD